jgi:hypothetical protein
VTFPISKKKNCQLNDWLKHMQKSQRTSVCHATLSVSATPLCI